MRRGRGPTRQGPDDGDPAVFVADEQQAQPVDAARWQALAQRTVVALGVTGDAELSVLFVDEDAIAELNGRFLGNRAPTDVLSFPIDGEHEPGGRSPDGGTNAPDRDLPTPDDLPLLLGDVVICPAVAARNAPGHAGTYEDELALLVVHGILHLLGHDHAEAAERQAMWDHERRLLAELHGPLAGDPWAAVAAEEAAALVSGDGALLLTEDGGAVLVEEPGDGPAAESAPPDRTEPGADPGGEP
jgi:probable rRNA maturation factor